MDLTPSSLKSNLAFRSLLEKLPAGAYTCDAAGLITYFNQQAVALWGRTPKLNDSIDRYCGSFKLFTTEGSPITHDACWMALALMTGQPYNGREIVVERPDGRRCVVLAHANPIYDEVTGELLGAVNVLVDISGLKAAQQALADSEAKFAKAFGLAPLYLAITSLMTGKFIEVNDSFVALTGYTREEAIGKTSDELRLWVNPEERASGIEELKRQGSIREREVCFRLKSGETRDCLISADVIDLDGVPCIINTVIDITERKRAAIAMAELNETLEAQVAARTQEVRHLASQLTLAEANERKRLGQVLHDDLQQQLYAAQFAMREVRQLCADTSVHDKLDEISALLKNAVISVRHTVSDLSPPVLPGEGLKQGLGWLRSTFRERFGLNVTLSVRGDLTRPNASFSALGVNLVRELLFNVVKHADVNDAAVAVYEADRVVEIVVSDQGKGFDTSVLEHVPNGTGLGLGGIRQRLKLFGGSMTVASQPSEGTRVHIILPLYHPG